VIGFDDIADAALAHPPLSTISLPAPQIGNEAARLILDRIENPEGAPRQVILPPRLVVRASCACKDGTHQTTSAGVSDMRTVVTR
jgi:LacI family transcriptional regulator